jgi:hypothetical protein
LEKGLSEYLTLSSIINAENYGQQNVLVLLKTLNPRPESILVGGGLSFEAQREVQIVLQNYNAAEGPILKLMNSCTV